MTSASRSANLRAPPMEKAETLPAFISRRALAIMVHRPGRRAQALHLGHRAYRRASRRLWLRGRLERGRGARRQRSETMGIMDKLMFWKKKKDGDAAKTPTE